MQGSSDAVLLYHEKQVASLCGVHCLNTLLQGPYFSSMDLAQIAQELDRQERAFMAEGGVDSEEYLTYLAEESGNVAADGNFSVQVLAKALEVWDLPLEPLDAPHMIGSAQHPEQEHAFICNLQEHWFTIRRIYADFWNFNSLFPAPQPLSQFYLSAFLATLREQGYTIFVVKGELPQQQHDDAGKPDSHGAWFTAEQAKAANIEASSVRQNGYLKAALQGTLDKATKMGNLVSLRPRGNAAQPSNSSSPAGGWEQWPDSEGGANEDDELQRAIAASLADPAQGSASGQTAPAESASAATARQIEATGPAAVAVVQAIQATAVGKPPVSGTAAADQQQSGSNTAPSLQPRHGHNTQGSDQAGSSPRAVLEDEPGEAEGTLQLAMRLPDNQRLQRRFRADAEVRQIAAYLTSKGLSMEQHSIMRSFPKQVLDQPGQKLSQAGLVDKEMLTVYKSR